MTWFYEGRPYEPDEEELSSWVGFVYCIEEKNTGKKYIGKKGFWRSKILPVTKTRKRRKRTLVESDWRKYYGSNTTLNNTSLKASTTPQSSKQSSSLVVQAVVNRL